MLTGDALLVGAEYDRGVTASLALLFPGRLTIPD